MTTWDEPYERMRNELPENEYERSTLIALAGGRSLDECYVRYWAPRGLSYEDLNAFIEKSSGWEAKFLCKCADLENI